MTCKERFSRRLAFAVLSVLSIFAFHSAAQAGAGFESGHVLVKFKSSVSASQANSIIAGQNHRSEEKIGGGAMGQIHRLAVPAGAEASVVAAYKNMPEVEYAELNQRVKASGSRMPASIPVAQAASTSKPSGSSSSSTTSSTTKPATTVSVNDVNFSKQWYLSDINAPTAWTTTTGSSSVVIAILDSGVDSTHPDLSPNIVAGYNFYDGNTNTADVQGHGTAVAGSAVEATNNKIGGAGVCWNCKIMPVRIAYNDNGEAYAYYSTVAQGMQWAIANGAKIENVSYEGLSGSSTILSAAQYVYAHGGLVFACAGNDSDNPGYAASPYLNVVSALQQGDTLASFSNFGANVTFTAPGNNIYTTMVGGGYGYWWGTSFSSPITAAVAALAWSENPALTNAQVQTIMNSAVDSVGGTSGWSQDFGYGKIDAAKAVAAAKASIK